MKRPAVPSFVSIVILTTITIIFWVAFEVFRVFTTKPAPNVPPEILEPLSPNLDTKVIDKIQRSIFFEEGQIPQTIISTPSASPSPIATATPTASAPASPTATSSGTPKP